MIRIVTRGFILITSLFYGVIFSGQVLGLLGIYSAALAGVVSVLTAGFLFWILIRDEALLSWEHTFGGAASPLHVGLLVAGGLLFGLLIFYPLVRWPYSPLSTELSWDGGLYHFPKAIEMLVTGSAWDLSIAYGEYPFGYESLVAFAFGLNPAGYLVGMVHAGIAAYFVLAFWLLIIRHTKIAPGLLLVMIVLLSLSFYLLPSFDSNIWWPFWTQISLIGKNDLLLGTLLLALAFLQPGAQGSVSLMALSMTSMMAVSVKPNAFLVVIFVWVLALYCLWRQKTLASQWKTLLFAALLMLPGVLWAARNLMIQGAIISTDASALADYSIAANLTNPFFYNYIPRQLMVIVAVIVSGVLDSIFLKRIPWTVSLTGVILLITFALTPASAFLGDVQQPAQIAWRFAIALLGYVFLVLVLLLEPVIQKAYEFVNTRMLWSRAALFLVVVLAGAVCWAGRDLMRFYPQNDIVLRDQYRQPVGVGGYFSAYDYVRQNVREAVVVVENGLPFYLYGPDITISVTRARPADYLVVLQTAWHNGQEQEYPDMIRAAGWNETWELVYEDSQGRVYKRRP